MSRHQFRPAVALLLIALSAVNTPASAHNADDNGPTGRHEPPRPGPDFPAPSSYFPAEAKRAGQEGATIIHICVDAHGKLTSAPAVVVSSGNGVLDSASVKVATAANGHYLPGTINGVAQESCGQFLINFELSGGARLQIQNFHIPTTTAHIEAITTGYSHRLADVEKAVVNRPTPEMLAAASPEAVRALRQFARALQAAQDEAAGIMADMMKDLENLGQSADIPDNERAVFIRVWPSQRTAFMHKFRQALSDSRDEVRALDELADFMPFVSSQHPIEGSSDRKAQTPSQDAQLQQIQDRVFIAIGKMRMAVDAL